MSIYPRNCYEVQLRFGFHNNSLQIVTVFYVSETTQGIVCHLSGQTSRCEANLSVIYVHPTITPYI